MTELVREALVVPDGMRVSGLHLKALTFEAWDQLVNERFDRDVPVSHGQWIYDDPADVAYLYSADDETLIEGVGARVVALARWDETDALGRVLQVRLIAPGLLLDQAGAPMLEARFL